MSSISSMLELQGLPPLPKSLTQNVHYIVPTGSSSAYHHHSTITPYSSHSHQHHLLSNVPSSSQQLSRTELFKLSSRPSPPVPPPRPTSRRSSSSGSSFRASPDRSLPATNTTGTALRSSPRSLSSSPHSLLADSGIGRSSADSSSEGRAFVRVIKTNPQFTTRLDAQLNQLKTDMIHLRQQDMALLGHLLQIHQGIQDLKAALIPASISHAQPLFPGPFPSSVTSGGSSSASQNYKQRKSSTSSQASSRLSILSSGASRLFSRRSSSDKLMLEALSGQPPETVQPQIAHHHRQVRRHPSDRGDEESDSLSSLEFGET